MTSSEQLESIPWVGPRTAECLRDLGFEHVSDLRGADPEKMYRDLCEREYTDRCVLYVFRCVTYYASTSDHDPELLKWWKWKDA